MSQKEKGGKKSFNSFNNNNNGGGKLNNSGGYKQQQQQSSPSTKSPPNTNVNINTNVDQDLETKKMKDRSLYMALCLVGYQVIVTLKNGVTYEGLLHSATTTAGSGWGIVLKMARKKEVPPPAIITTTPTPMLVIESKDFLCLTATGVVFDHLSSYQQGFGRGSASFQSDTDISGHDGVVRERELTPWISEGSEHESLEASSHSNKNISWDQFSTNEKLFGVTSSYDEDLYTTSLDRQSDNYKNRLKDAERIAQEIENKTSSNLHMQEERGQVKGTDYDEEERYSSVVRQPESKQPAGKQTNLSSSAGVYVPPSKRNQQQQQSQQQAASAQSAPVTPLSKSSSSTSLKDAEKQQQSSTTTTTSANNEKNNTPSKDDKLIQQQQIFKESPSNSANSLKTSSNGSGANTNDSSPVTKLRFPVRERTNSIDHNDVLSSPRDGQSPRTLATYTKLRAAIVSEKIRNSTEPRSPLCSPLVSDPVGLHALSLSSSKPQFSEDTIKEFNEFKLFKSEVDRKQQMEQLKSFSRDLNMNRSRPSSPLIGPNSPRITNISALSLSPSTPRQEKSDKDSTTTSTTTSTTSTATTTTTTEKGGKDEKASETNTPAAGGEKEVKKETKLNPNAKAFTPGSLSANAPVFTPKGFTLKPAIPAVAPGGHDFGASSGEIGRATSNTDPTTPINELYYDSMKKRQHNPENPESVSSFWSDVPSYRQPPYGGEDEYGSPAAAAGGYSMRPPIMVPIPPYFPSPPPMVAPPQIKSMKMPYNGQPRSGYPPQQPPPHGVPVATNPAGIPPPYAVFQPQFPPPYAVPAMYNPPPQPHGVPKRYFTHQNTYQPMQPHMMIPPQNTSQSPSPSHQSPQIPSPTSPTHSRIITPQPAFIPAAYQNYGPPPRYQNDPNQGYPPN